MLTPKRHRPQPFVASSLRRFVYLCVSARRQVAFFTLLIAATPSLAVTGATIIGPDLRPQRVRIQSLQGDQISYFDASRNLRYEALEQFLQIRDLPGAQHVVNGNADVPASFIELIDGQRLRGTWKGASNGGQTLLWQHPFLGEFAIELERLRHVVLGKTHPMADRTSTGDQLWLANGDVLGGYLESLGTNEIQWHPLEDDGSARGSAPVSLPLDRVLAIRLASTSAVTQRHHLVWLSDGSRVQAKSLSIAGDVLSIEAGLPPATQNTTAAHQIPLKRVTRIDLATLSGRLVDLPKLPFQVVRGGQVFGNAMPPRVRSDAIWLHAPVVLRFELPTRAVRFGATLQLALEEAEVSAGWADLKLRVHSDGQVVAEEHLHAKRRGATINVALTGSRFEIEVDEAANGPIMDRVWVRDAVVYVQD